MMAQFVGNALEFDGGDVFELGQGRRSRVTLNHGFRIPPKEKATKDLSLMASTVSKGLSS
jgi:hypothetical protein